MKSSASEPGLTNTFYPQDKIIHSQLNNLGENMASCQARENTHATGAKRGEMHVI